MRIIKTDHSYAMEDRGRWSELTGGFGTLEAAEQFVDSPPPDLRSVYGKMPEAVTIRQGFDGKFYVYSFESTPVAA